MPAKKKLSLLDFLKQHGVPAAAVVSAIVAVAWSDHNIIIDTKAQVQNLNRVADDIRRAAEDFQEKMDNYMRRVESNTVSVLTLESDIKVLEAKVNAHLQIP